MKNGEPPKVRIFVDSSFVSEPVDTLLLALVTKGCEVKMGSCQAVMRDIPLASTSQQAMATTRTEADTVIFICGDGWTDDLIEEVMKRLVSKCIGNTLLVPRSTNDGLLLALVDRLWDAMPHVRIANDFDPLTRQGFQDAGDGQPPRWGYDVPTKELVAMSDIALLLLSWPGHSVQSVQTEAAAASN